MIIDNLTVLGNQLYAKENIPNWLLAISLILIVYAHQSFLHVQKLLFAYLLNLFWTERKTHPVYFDLI